MNSNPRLHFSANSSHASSAVISVSPWIFKMALPLSRSSPIPFLWQSVPLKQRPTLTNGLRPKNPMVHCTVHTCRGDATQFSSSSFVSFSRISFYNRLAFILRIVWNSKNIETPEIFFAWNEFETFRITMNDIVKMSSRRVNDLLWLPTNHPSDVLKTNKYINNT